MVFQIALLLVTLSANFFCINAHGLLLYPNSRNWLARLDKVDFCPHCLNEVDVCGGWGPFIYNNPIEDYSIVGEYSPGEIMDVEIHINAHHKGHFEFFLCDPADTEGGVSSPATQECLDRHPLTVVNDENSLYVIDDNHSNRLYLPPTCALEMVSPVQDITGYLLRGQVILPSNVECSHCVLQWHYITGNSCNSEGYHDAIFPEDDCASWWNPQLPDCGTPEEFWNCADISVTGEAASGASRSSESPTSTPNQQSTAQPTNAASPTTSPTDQPTSTPNLRTAQPTSQSNGQPTAVPTPNDGNTNDSMASVSLNGISVVEGGLLGLLIAAKGWNVLMTMNGGVIVHEFMIPQSSADSIGNSVEGLGLLG
eukprot:CAMPEP_0117779296 /NCGR_PEP_ID=MMETSP0948-20121206/1518_1 /TAXON_ID=44440 /ORGANISM="Chattonella subsalsa, Strain CCMP2191" /LENGTH=367 /DNA_ID=CAMNT_0005606813 /DNA_START=325 /DNA_END=1429 /DNA_ORIENTATION=-